MELGRVSEPLEKVLERLLLRPEKEQLESRPGVLGVLGLDELNVLLPLAVRVTGEGRLMGKPSLWDDRKVHIHDLCDASDLKP